MIKKKAKGAANLDFGEVIEVTQNHVVTRRGFFDIDELVLPNDLLERYEDGCLWFKIEKRDADLFKRGI
jgi:hypothetical protein